MKKIAPAFPVVFDHIFKTAGTSIHKYFLDSFGSEFVPGKIAGTHYVDLLDHIKVGNVICAHLIPRPGDDILISCNYTVTILRDPIDRLYSQYNFMRADFNSNSKYYQESKIQSPEQYFFDRGEVSARFHNTYLNHFLQANTHYSPNLPKEVVLEMAREVMDRYAVVGIVPKIDEFIYCIAADLGITPPKETPKENVNRQATDVDGFTGSLKERLLEANAADYDLYQYANTLYLRKLSQRLNPIAKLHFPSLRSDIPVVTVAPKKLPAQFSEATGAEIISAKVFQENNWGDPIAIGTKTFVVMTFRVSHMLPALNPLVQISDSAGRTVYQTSLYDHGYQITKCGIGEYCLIATFKNCLGPGQYYVDGGLFEVLPAEGKIWSWNNRLFSFYSTYAPNDESFRGIVALSPDWFLYPIKGRSSLVKIGAIDFRAASGCFGRDVLASSPEFPPSRTFPFMHQALRTEVGVIKADGIHTNATAGYLIFGPYVAVLPGHYRIDFDILLIGNQSETKIVVDVSAEDGQYLVLLPRELQCDSGVMESVCFHVDIATPYLEIRLFVTSETKAVFKQYRLQHIF